MTKMKLFNSSKTIAIGLGMLASVISLQVSAETTSTSLNDQFKSGSLRLERSLLGSGVSGAADLKKMYDNKNWEELVKGVVSKRFVVNTYYFYLGAAAEDLGYPEAAYRYYELASKTSEKCSDYQTWTDTCVGFKFPDDALKKMAGLSGSIKGEEKKWPLGTGPTLSEFVGLSAISLENISKLKTGNQIVRDKFETDDEFQARLEKVKKGFLVISELDTSEGSYCNSTYDHAAGEYKISKCLPLVGLAPLATRRFEGDPVRLANMVDSRLITRKVKEEYFIASSFAWNHSIKASLEEAKKLDNELMVGVVAKEFAVDKACRSCDLRSGNGRKDAFLGGVANDDWIFTIRPSKIERFVIYRRSDSRVIYSFTPQLPN